MIDWIDKIYFPYIKQNPLCGSALLILDKASSHIQEEVIEKCTGILWIFLFYQVVLPV